MTLVSGKIIAPVNTDDVASAIGLNSHDFQTQCQSSKQNKWARFKAMQYSTPVPYTNAERKARQWGLNVPVHAINAQQSELPKEWSHALPDNSSFFPINNFVGDGANEGYVHAAPRLFTVELGVSGTIVNLTFTFNQCTDAQLPDNGGIRPKDLVVNGLTMSNLYPGAIVYKYDYSSGKYIPLQITTTNTTIGDSTSRTMSITIGGLDDGNLYIVPVFSPNMYLTGQTVTTSMTTQVIFADKVLEKTIDNDLLHGYLFTRKDIGLSELLVNNGTKYFKFDQPQTSAGYNKDDFNDYVWTFLTNQTLQLSPTNEYENNVFPVDERFAVTLTFVGDYYGNLGLGEYCPIDPSYLTSTASAPSQSYLGTVYNYGLCTWHGGADNDTYYLVLRYTPVVNNYSASNVTWKVTYSRQLIILDELGNVIASTDSIDMVVEKRYTNGDATIDGERISMIRLCNGVNDSGNQIYANRIFVKMYGESGTAESGSSAMTIGYVVFEGNNKIAFNTNQTDLKINRIPVQTNMYVDLTIDTMETVTTNPIFKFTTT